MKFNTDVLGQTLSVAVVVDSKRRKKVEDLEKSLDGYSLAKTFETKTYFVDDKTKAFDVDGIIRREGRRLEQKYSAEVDIEIIFTSSSRTKCSRIIYNTANGK